MDGSFVARRQEQHHTSFLAEGRGTGAGAPGINTLRRLHPVPTFVNPFPPICTFINATLRGVGVQFRVPHDHFVISESPETPRSLAR